jgi:cobalt-zinc-cadmium efflux system outer membrane protein
MRHKSRRARAFFPVSAMLHAVVSAQNPLTWEERDATQAKVFSDVDSAYAKLTNNLALLPPYKARYLRQAAKVRDTVSFAYQPGGACLLDFLNSQNDYRNIRLNYLNLVGSYLTAASQLNLAVGREVIQ